MTQLDDREQPWLVWCDWNECQADGRHFCLYVGRDALETIADRDRDEGRQVILYSPELEFSMPAQINFAYSDILGRSTWLATETGTVTEHRPGDLEARYGIASLGTEPSADSQ